MRTSFDEYLRYDDLTRTLHALAKEHPALCRVDSAGRSVEGREIWLVELTNNETGPADEKPAFWVDGNTHAGEVTGSMAALYLIENLLENYGSDDLVTRLDKSLELEILDQLGVRPAALEVRLPVDPGVGRAVEDEVVAEDLLDDAAIAGFIGLIHVTGEL